MSNDLRRLIRVTVGTRLHIVDVSGITFMTVFLLVWGLGKMLQIDQTIGVAASELGDQCDVIQIAATSLSCRT